MVNEISYINDALKQCSWLSSISIENLTLVYIKISAARKRDGDWSFSRPAFFQVTRFAGVYGGYVLLKISCSSCPVRARKIVLPGFLGQPSCLQRLSVDPRTGYWPSLGGAVEMREMLRSEVEWWRCPKRKCCTLWLELLQAAASSRLSYFLEIYHFNTSFSDLYLYLFL